jgi:hypothetical protein
MSREKISVSFSSSALKVSTSLLPVWMKSAIAFRAASKDKRLL